MKLSNNSGLSLLFLSLISMALLLSPSARGDVSVVFSSAMIGFIGQNTQEVCDPDTQPKCDVGMMEKDDDDGGLVPIGSTDYEVYQPRLSSAVGINYFAFTQETTLSEFADATTLGYNYTNQGNDVPGYLSIFYTDASGNAAVKKVNGAVAWNDKSGSNVDAIGFLIGGGIPNFSIVTNKGTVNFYGDMDGKNDCCEGGDSNIALITNNSSKTYVDKIGFKGSADTKFLDALNDYLKDPSSQPALTTTKTLYEVNGSTTIPSSVQSGDVLRYKIVLSNSGLIPVTTELTEAVPSGTSYTGTGEGWPTDTFKRVVSLNPSSSVELFFTVTVSSPLSGISSITNTVAASLGTCSSCTVSTPVQTPSLELVKTASALGASPSLGDVVTYTYLITNTGDVTLSNVGITADTLQTLASTPRSQLLVDYDGDSNTTMDVGDIYFLSGSTPSGACANKTLAAGASINCAATYLLTQAAFDDGGISNQATVTGSSPGNTNDVTDVSDDADDNDGNTTDDPTETPITKVATLEVVKTGSIAGVEVGDTITYTITVKNTGNVTITNVQLNDTLTTKNGGALTLKTGPTFQSATSGSSVGSLIPGETATYTATYDIEQPAIDAKGVENTVTATGKDPQGETVSDVSDDDNDSDGNTTNDPTETPILQTKPTLSKSVVLSTDADGSNTITKGDTLTYTIVLLNDGDNPINDNQILDNLDGFTQTSLTCSAGSTAALPSGNNTCTLVGTYVVTLEDANRGSITNTATSTSINSVSPFNTLNRSAQVKVDVAQNPAINVVKTASGTTGLGDVITYTFKVKNTGDVTLTSVGLSDVLKDAKGGALSLTTPITFGSASNGSSAGTLIPGETATYTATFKITQAVIDA